VHVRFVEPNADLKVLSVNAPTGQTSIIFPENSLSIALEMQVEILE
jgi:hypothetical protein